MTSFAAKRAVNKAKPATARLIVVRARPGRPEQGLLAFAGRVHSCALGRGGIRAVKREGDGATPLARMRLVAGFHRGWRRAPVSRLHMERIGARDGWCDEPGDRNYNRRVTLPYPASAESMMRADRLYDVCIVLDYNLVPRRRGMGSAIFLHIARPGYQPTEGCVAVSPRTMALMLPHLSPRTALVVKR